MSSQPVPQSIDEADALEALDDSGDLEPLDGADDSGALDEENDSGTLSLVDLPTATRSPGIVRRFVTTQRHLLALAAGGVVASVRERHELGRPQGLAFRARRIAASVLRLFLDPSIAKLPFPAQLRVRLERLGPTYIKLGQILSLREDLLPSSITIELKKLLDNLPAVPFPVFLDLVVEDLGRPIDTMFSFVDPCPAGSASIAQAHRATTLAGDAVILKVVKPGIRETLTRDATLLRMLGSILQVVLGRFQPKRILTEFCDYTLKEVDLVREADNARTFAANFRDLPDVVFPKVYREYSGRNVLCMEYLDGIRPDSPRARLLSPESRRKLVDLGAASIIRMLYRDGFFHADLHPANLLILPGPKVGFIDLGMVGRFDGELRRTLLYYYYCLVMGDSENAARYLAAVATPGAKGDIAGFRREVDDISRRWHESATFEGFSLGQLILESIARGGRYRMYFPVEMVLMVKALVTFEGVGNVLLPGFDVTEVSHDHIRSVFLEQFYPMRMIRRAIRGVPELMDAFMKAPLLVTEGLRVLERASHPPPRSPWRGLRATLLAGFCLLTGALLVGANAPWPLAAFFFVAAPFLAIRRDA